MDCDNFDINAGAIYHNINRNKKAFAKGFNEEFMSDLFNTQVKYGNRTYLILDKDLDQDKYYKQLNLDKGTKRGIPNRDYFFYDENIRENEYLRSLPFDQFAGMFNGEYGVPVAKKDIELARKTSRYYSLIDYGSICIVPKEGLYFDRFFALKIYFTEPEDLNDFFSFQFEKNFAQEKEVFEEYLENIVMKYDFFIKKNHTKKIKKFFLGLNKSKSELLQQKKQGKKINKKTNFFIKEKIQIILLTLKPYCSEEDFFLLTELIEKNKQPSSKILYTGTKRSFAYFLNHLFAQRLILNSTALIDIARWVELNFVAIHRKREVDFTVNEVQKILSNPSEVGKKSKFLVESFQLNN